MLTALARVSKRNTILKALAGTSWGQQKETLLMTYNYKAVGRLIADYAAPVWSTNTSMEKIQVAQNEALRISTGAHKMSSIDHLHCEVQMLKVTEQSYLLSAQNLVKCLDHENVCHNITTLDQPPRMMKHTLYLLQAPHHHRFIAGRHYQRVAQGSPHSGCLQSRRKQAVNRVLRDRPPDISETETSLRTPQRTILSQLRSGHCHLLNSYKHRIGREDEPQCKDCGSDNQDVNHLFNCPVHPTVMSPTKLWSMPADTIGEFAYLDPERLD